MRWLSARALAVRAPGPAAGPALAFFQFLLSPANAACSGLFLLGILDPTDELVASQRCDVPPSIEGRQVGDQRLSHVCGKLVHHPTGYSLATHSGHGSGPGQARFTISADPRSHHHRRSSPGSGTAQVRSSAGAGSRGRGSWRGLSWRVAQPSPGHQGSSGRDASRRLSGSGGLRTRCCPVG